MTIISGGVTSSGFYRDRLDVLKANLQAALRAPSVLGSDAVLDGTTPDGQILGIVSEMLDIVLQIAEDSYNVVDPNNAIGAALSRLGLLAGITEQTGQYGTVPCIVHVKQGETLYAGAQIQDEQTGVVYQTGVDVGPSESDSHDYVVTATATTYGVAAKTSHTAKKVVDQYGWIGVSFSSDGTAGTAPEAPAPFRRRRARSVAKPSQGMVDSMYAALADLPGVGDVKVFNNPTSAYADIKPGDGAIPPHSCIVVVRNAVVVGGVDQVANTIWLYKNPACDFVAVGASPPARNTTVTDTQGNGHKIGYYLASPYAIDVEITYKPIPGQGFSGQADIDAVKAALVTWAQQNQMPGDDLAYMDLVPVALGAVTGASGGYAIRIEQIRMAPHLGTLVIGDQVVPFNGYASLSAANITLVPTS